MGGENDGRLSTSPSLHIPADAKVVKTDCIRHRPAGQCMPLAKHQEPGNFAFCHDQEWEAVLGGWSGSQTFRYCSHASTCEVFFTSAQLDPGDGGNVGMCDLLERNFHAYDLVTNVTDSFVATFGRYGAIAVAPESKNMLHC